MPLDKYDHFDFATTDKPLNFFWDNNENMKTLSGDIEIAWNNSWYIESIEGNVNVHGYNSGGIELEKSNIEIHSNNSGSISSKLGNIKVWGSNTLVIETSSGDVFVRENKWTIITETGNIKIWKLNIKVKKSIKVISIVGNTKKTLRNVFWKKNKGDSSKIFKEYVLIVDFWGIDPYEIDYYNKQIIIDGVECQSHENFDGDNIKINFVWQNIIITENRVIVSYEDKEKKDKEIGDADLLSANIRDYIR